MSAIDTPSLGIGLRTYDLPLINSTDKTKLLDGMCLCVETPYYELNLDGMMAEDTRELFVLP